jgi:hypothetical protein
MQPEPILRDVSPIGRDNDTCQHVENEEKGAHLVFPPYMNVFANIDVAAIVNTHVQNPHDESEYAS